jgi:hypothetical protein
MAGVPNAGRTGRLVQVIVFIRALHAAAHTALANEMDHRDTCQLQPPGGQQPKCGILAQTQQASRSAEENNRPWIDVGNLCRTGGVGRIFPILSRDLFPRLPEAAVVVPIIVSHQQAVF